MGIAGSLWHAGGSSLMHGSVRGEYGMPHYFVRIKRFLMENPDFCAIVGIFPLRAKLVRKRLMGIN